MHQLEAVCYLVCDASEILGRNMATLLTIKVTFFYVLLFGQPMLTRIPTNFLHFVSTIMIDAFWK